MNVLYKRLKYIIKKNIFLFIVYYNIRVYGIYLFNRISNYRIEKIKFYKRLGYPLNLTNPKSFNEKVVWKKIYDRNPLLPITADKYAVRSYLKEALGEQRAKEILIPLLYVTDQPKTIPFDKLPSSFIVKPNHASGRKIIVKDGQFNKQEIINTCHRWLHTYYGLEKMEWAYRSIKRKIIIEKLLLEDRKIPNEFLINMFHGKIKMVNVVFNGLNDHSLSYFDEKWNYISVMKKNRTKGPIIKKPENYEIMVEIAEKLSKPFDYVRVDLYNMSGKIYFGELTHYTTSGYTIFEPKSFDHKLGRYWKAEVGYWEKKY